MFHKAKVMKNDRKDGSSQKRKNNYKTGTKWKLYNNERSEIKNSLDEVKSRMKMAKGKIQ